jgi:hypothetical protein
VVIISIQHPIVDWWILTVLTPMYPCWRLPTLNCTEIMEVQCTRFLFFFRRHVCSLNCLYILYST